MIQDGSSHWGSMFYLGMMKNTFDIKNLNHNPMQYFKLNNFVVAWQFPKFYDLHCNAITKEKLSSHLSVCLQISHPGLNICILCDSVCKINPMKFISNYAQLVLTPEFPFKRNLQSKKSLAQMKEHEKWKTNEPSPTSIRQMVLEIFHFKVRNLSNMDVTIL